jgi:hypothetical protein
MATGKAVGADGISAEFIKSCTEKCPEFCNRIETIFQDLM